MSNDEIKDIVSRLQTLQIEQSSLIERLARVTEGRPNVVLDERTTRTTIPVGTATSPFGIGDTVRVRNPGLLQQATGTVTKVTDTRVYIRTPNGGTLWRAPKNLIITRN
jgi:hypothetical protein